MLFHSGWTETLGRRVKRLWGYICHIIMFIHMTRKSTQDVTCYKSNKNYLFQPLLSPTVTMTWLWDPISSDSLRCNIHQIFMNSHAFVTWSMHANNHQEWVHNTAVMANTREYMQIPGRQEKVPYQKETRKVNSTCISRCSYTAEFLDSSEQIKYIPAHTVNGTWLHIRAQTPSTD